MTSEPMYCSQCGSILVSRRFEGRQRYYCTACDQVIYQNSKPCAGILVVDGDELLLVERTEPPAVGAWSLPAGYLEADEPPKQAAVRELEEETGLRTTTDSLSLVDTVFVEHPDGNHILVVIYAVRRSETSGEPVAGSDAAAARFWRHSELQNHESERLEPGYTETIQYVQELFSGR